VAFFDWQLFSCGARRLNDYLTRADYQAEMS
jgi:hypothetical protein